MQMDQIANSFLSNSCAPEVCYVIVSADGGASYVGTTNCIERRLRQHNGYGGARYTRGRRPWRLLCCVDGFVSRAQCLSFEWHVKHVRGVSLTLNTQKTKRTAATRCNVQHRRAQQLHIAEQQGRWWQRHPPRPAAALRVRWFNDIIPNAQAPPLPEKHFNELDDQLVPALLTPANSHAISQKPSSPSTL